MLYFLPAKEHRLLLMTLVLLGILMEISNSRAADSVVEEIRSKGGKAVANYDSVINGESIIKTAIEEFGRIDVVVNNAGISRGRSFSKMSALDWDLIMEVHLQGAFQTIRAAWEHFRKQNNGRIINTSSTSGLLGGFGHANYAAAKAGLIGFSSTLAIEGAKLNIHTNTLAPFAGSRMTQGILPPELHAALKPELVSPVVAWLCHEECTENGAVIETAAGYAARYAWQRSRGAYLRHSLSEDVTIESVRDKWDDITDMTGGENITQLQVAVAKFGEALEAMECGRGQVPDAKRAD